MELLIVMVVIFAVAAGIALAAHSGDHGAAEESAHMYANELGVPVKAVSCVGVDTDGDGYVSCTIMRADDPSPMMVECAGAWTWSSGCRAPKLNGRGDW